MNKEQFVKELAKETSLSNSKASECLSSMLSILARNLKKGERITFVGFGTFSVRKRAARKGRNPQTGKELKIPAKKVAHFSAGKKLKETVHRA